MPKKISTVDKPEKKVRRRKSSVDGAEKKSPKRSPKTKKIEPPAPAIDLSNREKIYALDIGTRSVIGIVAVKEDDGTLTIVATKRREHKTRAMLDGQIHDVPKVAAIIRDVTDELERGNLVGDRLEGLNLPERMRNCNRAIIPNSYFHIPN